MQLGETDSILALNTFLVMLMVLVGGRGNWFWRVVFARAEKSTVIWLIDAVNATRGGGQIDRNNSLD